MTVYINSSFFTENTPVFIAKTIIHETIHASIYQKVASSGGYEGLSSDNFEGLFRYYNSYGEDFSHQYMAGNYINDLASTLSSFDGSRYLFSYYEAIAWSGLWESYEWQNKTQEEKNSVYAKIELINSGSKKCK